MEKVFYITRDVERAAGLLGARDDIFVITNPSPLAAELASVYQDHAIVIDEHKGLSTLELLRNKLVRDRVRDMGGDSTPGIVVFKNSPQIERACEKNGWKLLNPSCEAGAVLEEKIGQWKWLNALRQSFDAAQDDNFELPQVWLGKTSERTYNDLLSELGESPIVQFNRGHTGLGTFRLESEKQWKELQKKFPNREVKVSRFYEGKAYTVNAVILEAGSWKLEAGTDRHDNTFQIPNSKFLIHTGHISEQLTGIAGCTNNPYATVGNDWSAGAQLPEEIKKKVHSSAEAVGMALAERGYCGMFGIDVIVATARANGRPPTGEAGSPVPILIEVNPRQPASATMESQLQRGEVSVMERHVIALIQNSKLKTQNNRVPLGHFQIPDSRFQIPLYGFQLFFRNLESRPLSLTAELTPGRYELTEKGMNFIAHAASVADAKPQELYAFSEGKNVKIKPGAEILRIQSKQGIVDTLGPKFLEIISQIRAAMPIQ